MTTRSTRRRGNPILVGYAAALVGVAAFVWGVAAGDGSRAWGALITNWLFFSGAALGAIAFGAVLRIVEAQWARSLVPLTQRGLSFLPVSAGVLLLLVIGASLWVPWADHVAPNKRFWLNLPLFTGRHIVGGVALFGAGWWFVRRHRRDPETSRRAAVGYCLVYAVVLTVWAFDFVLALDHEWVSTLIGAHVFMGAFLSGIALVALLGVASDRADESQRHDLGKLAFGFSIFWAYLLWSQYLPIWYGNLPEETGFVLVRSEAPWSAISVAVVVLTFAVPFIGLFRADAKKNRQVLGTVAAAVLVGLWLERHLLVQPSMLDAGAVPFGITDALIAIGFIGAFGVAVGRESR